MQGRRLESIARGNKTYSYTYNAEGIRTSKTVNGVKREYILNGTQILGEIWSDGTTIIYIYDAEGAAIGMLYRDSNYEANKFDAFFYERNLQGDVIAVYDCEDTKLVSYTYDAWGNVSITYSNGGDLTGAQYNPFTYRGYYRDAETGFYYLNSRYYDPAVGRFINPDSFVSTGQELTGYNMYAYCGNNPVMRADESGQGWFKKLVKAVAVVTVVAVVAVATVVTVATCGAGSAAGVAMITGTLTLAAKATEVTALQVKKSKEDGDSDEETTTDVVESLFDNGADMLVKSYGFKALTTTAKVTKNRSVSKVLGKHKNGTISYLMVIWNWNHTIDSIRTDDYETRAEERRYVLN